MPERLSDLQSKLYFARRYCRLSKLMRPRGILASILTMATLSLMSAVVTVSRAHRFFVATLAAEILIVLISCLVLWFFWKGKNWARLFVLVVSVGSIINLLALIHPYGNVVVYDSILIAWALVGFFLLYWLNLADVREWFRIQKKLTECPKSDECGNRQSGYWTFPICRTNQSWRGTTCLSTRHLSTAVNSYPAN